MRLTPPTTPVFVIAVIALALGILLHLGVVSIAALQPFTFWLAAGAALLLAAGALFRGV